MRRESPKRFPHSAASLAREANWITLRYSVLRAPAVAFISPPWVVRMNRLKDLRRVGVDLAYPVKEAFVAMGALAQSPRVPLEGAALE